MRVSILDAVVSKHLRLLRHRIHDLTLILTGRGPIIVPTLAEEHRFRAELREDDLVERALTELVPQFWPISGTATRRPRLVAEARVLAQLRSLSAVLAVGLGLAGETDDRRAMAAALFRYAETALKPYEFEDDELLPGAAAQYERIVAYALFGQRWGSI